MYFAAERQLTWIARPDYYRSSWGKRFDAIDQEFDEQLTGIGRVVHQSSGMIVRSVSITDLDEFQRSRLPSTTPSVIDFETAASEPFKLRGISPRKEATAQLPGYAWLYVRQPAKLVFTLHGYEDPPSDPPIHTRRLRGSQRPADSHQHVTDALAGRPHPPHGDRRLRPG